MRDQFIAATTALLDGDPRTALVLADISAAPFAPAARRHPDRVINVGIREQLMIGVAGGLALTGMRPIAHSYATFLVDRAYEQIKVDLDHQGSAAILVSVGASYDASESGRTHHSPGDVALLDTLGGWTVRVPGHPAEVGPLLRAAARHDDPEYVRLSAEQNATPHEGHSLLPVKRGTRATIVAVGPMLDPVLAATAGLDVTVAYTNTPRPFDAAGLRALVAAAQTTDVVLVEPYLAGTSAGQLARALVDLPHRLLALGVGRGDLRAYGRPADHARRHGLDPRGLRQSLGVFLDTSRSLVPAL
jgi:transketolase